MNTWLARSVGWMVTLRYPPVPKRDERGLSQSSENAILLAGAVIVAGVIIAAIKTYVEKNLPK